MKKTQRQIYRELEEQVKDVDIWDTGISKDYTRLSQDDMLKLIKKVPHARILEVGCASGNFTRRLVEIADLVVGIDVSKTEIARAKLRIPQAKFYAVSMEQFHTQEPFDVIVCSEVLYYIQDHKTALKSLRELGRYLVTSHYIAYGPQISFGSFRYEIALTQAFKKIKTITEFGKWFIVQKGLWKIT
jgi:2-polyprenyl-3-methyl-5-hydroxy-6-metoxy-1,4-benzoquinol methylase